MAQTPAPGATSGSVESPSLAQLLDEHWAAVLSADPLFATSLGVRDHDDRLDDRSEAGRSAKRAVLASFLDRARGLDPSTLNQADRTTLLLFVEELESDLAAEPCRFADWSLSPRTNPVTEWNYLPELHRVDTPEDLTRLLSRYRAIPAAIDQDIANLRRGAAEGLFSNAESTRRVLEMVKRQLDAPLPSWPLMAPAAARRPEWPSDEQTRLELADAVKSGIVPALERYRALLEQEILPFARPEDQTGVGVLPFGPECYAAQIRRFTTLPLDAADLHEVGLAEAARIDREMAELGQKLFGLTDRGEVLHRLRTDPALHFKDAAEVQRTAEEALSAAKGAMYRAFGRRPEADCVVRVVPDYEAPFTTIAYYRQPAPDGSKPGEYFINVHEPTTRPRYEAEALAFHESIPGHHLQIAIAQELPALPAFRRHGGMTVFVEGWALYTEALADEMGLYSGDLDRMGKLSFEAWRAARLVVDTGLHALGWSRAQAKDFMQKHTALADNNIDNEVDRYITWPGQALGYKTGQMEITRLRRTAEARLGPKFDLASFHDAVLGGGAVTLSVLGEQVEAYIRERSR